MSSRWVTCAVLTTPHICCMVLGMVGRSFGTSLSQPYLVYGIVLLAIAAGYAVYHLAHK